LLLSLMLLLLLWLRSAGQFVSGGGGVRMRAGANHQHHWSGTCEPAAKTPQSDCELARQAGGHNRKRAVALLSSTLVDDVVVVRRCCAPLGGCSLFLTQSQV
jgi:hypothetical protein